VRKAAGRGERHLEQIRRGTRKPDAPSKGANLPAAPGRTVVPIAAVIALAGRTRAVRLARWR